MGLSASIQASTNDGEIDDGGNTNWTLVRNGQYSPVIYPHGFGGTYYWLRPGAWQTTSSYQYTIQRGFLQFDLSAIPPGSKANSAALKIYAGARMGVSATKVIITKGYQSDPLVVGDFDIASPWTQRDETTDRGSKKQGDFTLGQYNTIDFNSSGLGMIGQAMGGTLKVCIRFQTDIEDTPPANIGVQQFAFKGALATGYEPSLEIYDYQVPSAGGALKHQFIEKGLLR